MRKSLESPKATFILLLLERDMLLYLPGIALNSTPNNPKQAGMRRLEAVDSPPRSHRLLSIDHRPSRCPLKNLIVVLYAIDLMICGLDRTSIGKPKGYIGSIGRLQG